MPLAINPETKVAAVLEAYPFVEDKLIEQVPLFARLRNPILRRSVARIATLDQAAKIASIPVRDLVAFLREQTGQDTSQSADLPNPTVGEVLQVLDPNRPLTSQPPPDWFSANAVGATMDADAVLASGRHPLGEIHQCLRNLEAGNYLKLTSTFLPAPLLDAMREKGVGVYWRQTGSEAYVTYLLPHQ